MATLASPQRRQVSDGWLYAKPLWAGLAIVTMWLAVLFVGVFADGNIVNTTGGTKSTVPVVVVVALAALVATIVIGARAFKADDRTEADDLRRALEEERKAREELAAELEEFLRSVAQ